MKPALAILSVCVLTISAAAQPTPKAVTVPITLDHNRTIIDVYFSLPDGQTKRVRGWVDNGTAELELTEALAQKLGLAFKAAVKPHAGDQRGVDAPRSLQIGGLTIALDDIKEAKAIVGSDSIAPGCSAEINIPAPVLRHYDVLFDYPNRQFTIGPQGSVAFEGTRVKAQVNPQNGLVQIASQIGGQDYNLAFDAGSSTSLLSGELLGKWHAAHPAWPQMTGAIAAANLWGAEVEAHWQLLRLPNVQYGGVPLKDVVVAPFSQQFMDWYRERAGIATVGLIGASAFLDDRVGIDYAHATLYVQRTASKSAPDMDVVGLTLRPEADGKYTVIGVPDFKGKPAVPDVKGGEFLVGVDGAPATGATMGQVWSLLGGTPGQTRSLILERDGKRFTVEATVRRFLAGANAQPEKNRLPRVQK
jgi:hypothetical protein